MKNKEDNNKKLFSENLKYFLAINNKSRKDMSRDLKISYTTICDWVNGKTVPRSTKYEIIANYFGIDVAELYSDHLHVFEGTNDLALFESIKKYADNKHQEELLIKSTQLDLDNTKKAIEQIDYYLYKQNENENEFKWLDKYNDKKYDK